MSARTSPSRLSLLPLAAAALVAPVLAGCEIPIAMMIADDVSNDDEVIYGDDGYYGGDDYSTSALGTKNGSLQGDLGEAIGFAGDANYIDAWDDGYYSSITIWAGGGDGSGKWAAMSSISIEGGLDPEVFKPGAKLHFSSDDYSDGLYVTGYGCSGKGSDADNLDYEASGSETDIDVSEAEDPGMVHLSYKVTYDSGAGPQVVTGEVDVVVPEAE